LLFSNVSLLNHQINPDEKSVIVKFSVYLIGTILLLHVNQISAQDLITKEGRIYNYQSQSYRYQELRDILKNKASAFTHYQQYHSARNKAKIFGYSSLGLMASGFYFGSIKKESNCSSGGVCPDRITGILLGLASILPGTIAIAYSIKASDHRIKSINTFNNHSKNSKISIKLGATKNGIGVIINF